MGTIKLKAVEKEGMVEFKALISHPMETGQRKDKATNELIPAHYIEEVVVTANDKNLMTAHWGTSVSKNPYLAFSYKGKKGDKIKLTWKDNKGESDSADTDVI